MGGQYKLSGRDKKNMDIESLGIVIVAQEDKETREWELCLFYVYSLTGALSWAKLAFRCQTI